MEDRVVVIVKESSPRLVVVAEQGPMGVPNPAYGDTEALENLVGSGYAFRVADSTWELHDTIEWAVIVNTPTTVAGYGIVDALTLTTADARYSPLVHTHVVADITDLDAYTTAEVDGFIAGRQPLDADLTGLAALATLGYVRRTGAGTFNTTALVPWADLSGVPTTLAGYGITDPIVLTSGAYANPVWITSFAWAKLTGVPATFPSSAHTHDWADVTGTPTTVAGYGITDVYTKTAADARYSPLAHTHPWADVTGAPTTLAGYGITDAYTKTASDARFAALAHTHAWADVTGTPTTLAGYGIADAYTKTASDARYATLAHTHAWADVTGTPTTLAGYGIVDAYTKVASDARFAPIAVPWASITGTPTTVAGYGITDVYTKTQADARYQPLDSDLTAVAALAGTGIAVQTAVGAWAQRTITAGVNVGVTQGDGVAGNPTIAVTALDNAPVGATTPSTGKFTTLVTTGLVGINTAISADTIASLGGTHSSAATTIFGGSIGYTIPATATVAAYGHRTSLTTAASVFTLALLNHYAAFQTTKGATSGITAVNGFFAANAIAQGVTNKGFSSDIAAATTTWQLHMGGTAESYFAGPVGIGPGASGPLAVGSFLYIGNGTHPATGTTVIGVNSTFTGPATATAAQVGFQSVLTTAVAAYTLVSMIHFLASSGAKGAGSAVTTAYGFRATNSIAVGVTNYGFNSDINANAASNFQFAMLGTAPCFINSAGGLAIGAAVFNPVTSNLLLGFSNAHTGTGTTTAVIGGSVRGAATGTAALVYVQAVLLSAVSAYVLTDMIGFQATTWTAGAGSTVTNAKAFAATSTFAVGSNNYSYWTDLNTSANNYAFYGAGTAKSLFGGAIIEKEVTVVYSVAMTPDASLGNEQIITATNATAFAINAPTNPATGQYLEVTLRNTSGGALGAATWNGVFKMTAWTNPANGFSRTIVFRYNGANWVEKGRTAADVPN